MKNTNTNPHAGIDYIMPGEEEDCGIEEVTKEGPHDLIVGCPCGSCKKIEKDFMKYGPNDKRWPKVNIPQAWYNYQQNQRNPFDYYTAQTREGNNYRYSNSGPNA